MKGSYWFTAKRLAREQRKPARYVRGNHNYEQKKKKFYGIFLKYEIKQDYNLDGRASNTDCLTKSTRIH